MPLMYFLCGDMKDRVYSPPSTIIGDLVAILQAAQTSMDDALQRTTSVLPHCSLKIMEDTSKTPRGVCLTPTTVTVACCHMENQTSS